MGLTLGIRLVIILPTLLFLIGFVFKAIIERKSLKQIMKEEKIKNIRFNLISDFYVILSIDSIFLSIANGLIHMFQLQQIEIGIIVMIGGVILSMCLLIGIYANSHVAVIGVLGVFGFLTGELVYFTFFDIRILIISIPLECIFSIIGIIAGIMIGISLVSLANPYKKIKKN